MTTPQTEGMPPTDIEIAAGGLVWRLEDSVRRLAVVHRSKHGDWTLPKGRTKPGEALEATALREAKEETRCEAVPDKLAGSYCYTKEERVKVVLMWHMSHLASPYQGPTPKNEIDEVLWLTPDQALNRLSHAAEREFLQRHSLDSPDVGSEALTNPPGRFLRACRWMTDRLDPQLNRLKARLQSVQERFGACTRRLDEEAAQQPGKTPDRWWVPAVRRSLDKATEALEQRDLDGGWGALHDAEKFLVFGLNDVEVIARAISIKAEAQKKLGAGWRSQAVEGLLGTLNLKECLKTGGVMKPGERRLVEQALVESLTVLNEGSDNVYHRMHLVGTQLNFLVAVCAYILAATLFGSFLLADPDSEYGWGRLVAVAMAGALGGVVSAMFQLSRVGEAKIPDALLYGLITTGRPLLGAASAIFIYFVMQAKLISFFTAPAGSSLEAGVVVGFVAGFSERLVLKAVDKFAGAEKADSTAKKKHGDSSGESGANAGGIAKPK